MDLTLAIIAQVKDVPASIDLWDIIISIGFFAFIVLLVVSVFSQKGQPRLSPQREAAIATGHDDRKTIFENPVFKPIMWMFLSMSYSLNVPKLKEWLNKQLIAAGSPKFYTPEEYLAMCFMAGLTFAFIIEIFTFLVTGTLSLMAILLGLVMGVCLKIYQISEKAQKRLREITHELPYSLDLISLSMGAGATFTEAIQSIIRETRPDQEEQPLNAEYKALLSEIELGTTRREALNNLSRRIPLESVQNLTASVAQAEQLGTPLAVVLHDQSTQLRLQRTVMAEESAAKAGVRILVPCLLLVMAAILTVFGPFIIRIMREGMF